LKQTDSDYKSDAEENNKASRQKKLSANKCS
jgi:hypothetical protein